MKKIIIFLVLFAFFISFVSAAGTLSVPSVCCEKTKQGASCINTAQENCNPSFLISQTSCESTSYCKQGTCYDSKEGVCMENTPRTICDNNKGTWDEREANQIPQCQLGCCIIADQAAFVPLVRCKRLSSFFGVTINYKKDIVNEVECIAQAQSQVMGACVYEKEFERTCKFTTRGDCKATNVVEVENATKPLDVSSDKKFYENYLCSAEELGTQCAKQIATNCYQQKVYWMDSCGNRENIYSGGNEAQKAKSWNNGKVLDADSICKSNDGSNKECGNCDYLLGTRCQKWSGVLGVGKPAGSDYFCKKTVCVDRNGKERKNGEAWCVFDSPSGETNDPAGARYNREICIDGQVQVEPCADFRNEVCYQDSIEIEDGEYSTAACRVNRWQECLLQIKQKDCENQDRRDCVWMATVTGLNIGTGEKSSQPFSQPSQNQQVFSGPVQSQATGNVIATGQSIFGGSDEEEVKTTSNRPGGVCVPNFPPGLKFWEQGDAQGICNQATATCTVSFEKKLIGSESCVDNCECLEAGWATQVNNVCKSLGDCGGYINFQGTYTEDGYEWKVDGKEQKFTPSQVNTIKAPFTGKSISVSIVGKIIQTAEGLTGDKNEK